MGLSWALFRNLPDTLRRKTSRGQYEPSVDGMRFFAIAMVVMGHLASRVERFSGGASPAGSPEKIVFDILIAPDTGVLLFFSISGFILAKQFLHQPLSPLSSKFLGPYYVRRIQRIEPPYFILLILTAAVVGLTGFAPPASPRFEAVQIGLLESLALSLLYSHAWVLGELPKLFPPGWSLEVEVQFYLIAPLLFLTLRRRPGSSNTFIPLLLFALFLGLSILTPDGQRSPFWQFTLIRFAVFFWLGALMAANEQSIVRLAAPSAVGWVGIAGLALSDFLFVSQFPAPILRTCFQLLMIALAFLSVLNLHSNFRSFCAKPWIALIGSACYSIYLVHLQILHLGVFHLMQTGLFHTSIQLLAGALLLIAPITLLSGLMFYAFVERPFMSRDWHVNVWRRVEPFLIIRTRNRPDKKRSDSEA